MSAIPEQAPPATVVLAGLSDDTPILEALAGPATRVLVLEPDPERAAALALAHAGLEVIPAALGATTDTAADLVQYNQPGLRSINAPTAHLRTLFPGLRERRRIKVARLAVSDLPGDLVPEAGGLELWLDLGGDEAAVLEAAGLLEKVTGITLRCGMEPLFEGAVPLADLLTRLRAAGFMADPAFGGGDPDIPHTRLIPDPLVVALRAQLATQAQEAAARLAEQQDRAQAERAMQRDEINRLRDDLTTTDGVRRAAEARSETLQADLGACASALSDIRDTLARAKSEADLMRAERDGLQSRLEEREAALAKARTTHDRLQAEAETARVELTRQTRELQDRLDAQTTRDQERVAALDSAEKTRISLQERLARMDEEMPLLRTEIETTQGAAATLTETLSAAQADISRLQNERTRAVARTRELQDLLTARTDRVKELNVELDGARQKARTEAETLTASLAERDSRLTGLEQRIPELMARAEAAEAAREAAERRADTQRTDLAMALRLQVVAQNDLRELQGRFESSESRRQQQETLLRQLTPRLRQAAVQLQDMTGGSGAPDLPPASDAVPGADLEDLAAPASTPEPAPASEEAAADPAPAKPRRKTTSRSTTKSTSEAVPEADADAAAKRAPKAKPAAKPRTRRATSTAKPRSRTTRAKPAKDTPETES